MPNFTAFVLIILYLSIHIPTFSVNTYINHYREAGTAELIQISEEELIMVTLHMLDYMRGRADDLQIRATIAGQERDFFSSREIDHMVDVMVLFWIGRILRNIAIGIFALTAFFVYKKTLWDKLIKIYFFGSAGLILSLTAFTLLILANFERSFIIFHEIFFFNDYWILNPRVDLLINLVPEVFFVNIFIRVAVIFLSVLGTLALVSGLLFFRKRLFKKG